MKKPMIRVWLGTYDPAFGVSGKHFVKTGEFRSPNFGEFFLIGHEVFRMINTDYTRDFTPHQIMKEWEGN